jgi:hypothetical protein
VITAEATGARSVAIPAREQGRNTLHCYRLLTIEPGCRYGQDERWSLSRRQKGFNYPADKKYGLKVLMQVDSERALGDLLFVVCWSLVVGRSRESQKLGFDQDWNERGGSVGTPNAHAPCTESTEYEVQ